MPDPVERYLKEDDEEDEKPEGPILGPELPAGNIPADIAALLPTEEKKPPKIPAPPAGQISEAIRQGFEAALSQVAVHLSAAQRIALVRMFPRFADRLKLQVGKFGSPEEAAQGASYYMSNYVLPAVLELGEPAMLAQGKEWPDFLNRVLGQTEALQAKMSADPVTFYDEAPMPEASQLAREVAASAREQFIPKERDALWEPDATPQEIKSRLAKAYAPSQEPMTIGEKISAEREARGNQATAMKAAGYVPSVRGGWVRPGEQGSAEAEEFARQGREATFRAVAPMVQAGETAADERQAQRAQEERIAAQVAPYTGTVPKSYSAREAFEVGRGNLGALEALASGGRAAYESAKLGTNIEQKFGQTRLRSEFPTPSAGYETSIAGQWGGGNPVEISQKMQAAREPWTARRMTEPLAAQFPKEWEQYAAPRTYGWEKGYQPGGVTSTGEPFDMPFEDFIKKRRTPLAAPAPRGRSIFRFGRS